MKSSFGRSFSVFAGILLVALTVLGGSFQMMVQDYLTETSFTRLEQDAAIKTASADDVILEYKSEATEVASVLAEDPTAIGLLPQPFVTAACMQNDALKVIFDLNEEWNKVQGEDGSSMVTGVTVVRKEFLEENEEAVKSFMEDHKASAEDINADPATGAALAVEAQIVAKEPIAQKAIPNCNITYIDKAEMKQALSGYLDVLFHQDSLSIGGGLPESDFYYDAE